MSSSWKMKIILKMKEIIQISVTVFLLTINSILILISISLFYVATIFYYKAKLDLAYFFDEIDLLDKDQNCVFSYGKKNLEGQYISYYKSCDENINGVVDTTYFMDADKEVYSVEYDLNEDEIYEYFVNFDKFKREVSKCYYSEDGISIKSCLTTYEDDSKNIYERFVEKGPLIETNEYLNSESKRIIKISNFGKQGIKIEN